MDSDRRITPRYLFSEPVAYACPEVTVNGSVAGNISLSGISLKVQEFVPMGAVMELKLCLGQASRVIWAKAQVVRVREVSSEDCYEIGLQFVRDEECTRAIGKFISDCRSESIKEKESKSHG